MPNAPTVRERVEELTWALVDDQITDDEFRLLENMILSDDAARETYLDCIQMHADLVGQYSQPGEPSMDRPPVLGCFGDAFPPTEAQPIQ